MKRHLSNDYEYEGYHCPWAIIWTLQIISHLTENDPAMTAKFLQTFNSIMEKINHLFSDIDCAILYQLLLTCLKSFPTKDLLNLCLKKFELLEKFEPLKRESRRVLELQVIGQFIRIDKKYLSRFQVSVVECLESYDETVRSLAIDVLFEALQENNCKPIVTQIQTYIKVTSNPDLKKKALNRLLSVLESMAPSPEWYVENAWDLLIHSQVNQKVIARILYNKQEMLEGLGQDQLPEVVANLMIKMSDIIQEKKLNEALAHCFVWFLGQNIAILRVLQYSHSQILELIQFLNTRLDDCGLLVYCDSLLQLRNSLKMAASNEDVLISGDTGKHLISINQRFPCTSSFRVEPHNQ
jgi:hypothetical protein